MRGARLHDWTEACNLQAPVSLKHIPESLRPALPGEAVPAKIHQICLIDPFFTLRDASQRILLERLRSEARRQAIVFENHPEQPICMGRTNFADNVKKSQTHTLKGNASTNLPPLLMSVQKD